MSPKRVRRNLRTPRNIHRHVPAVREPSGESVRPPTASPLSQRAACPLCAAERLVALPTPRQLVAPELFRAYADELGLKRCARCSFTFTDPRPACALLAAYAGGLNMAKSAMGDRPRSPVEPSAKASFLLDAVERCLAYRRVDQRRSARVPYRIFDYGAAQGGLLAEATRRGYRAVGLEVGEAFHLLREKGFDVVRAIEELATRRFDAVVLNQVLEHVPDPVETLARLREVLEPGGVLVVQVPNASSLRSRLASTPLRRLTENEERYTMFPVHLAYFTQASLARTVRAAGFQILEEGSFGLGGWGARREGRTVAPPRRATKKSFGRLARKATGWFVKRMFGRIGLGEHLLVVATRC